MDAIILLALLTLVAIIFLILLARRWDLNDVRERLRKAEDERDNFRQRSKHILEMLGYQPLSDDNLLQKFDQMILRTEASLHADTHADTDVLNILRKLREYGDAVEAGKPYDTSNIHRQIDECKCPDVKDKVREELNKLIERVQRNN